MKGASCSNYQITHESVDLTDDSAPLNVMPSAKTLRFPPGTLERRLLRSSPTGTEPGPCQRRIGIWDRMQPEMHEGPYFLSLPTSAICQDPSAAFVKANP